MPWGAVAGAVVGGVMQSNASKRAARTQANAADTATDEQRRQYDLSRGDTLAQLAQSRADTLGQYAQNRNDMLAQYNQGRADQAPWLEAGRNTLGQLTGRLPELTQRFTPGDLQNDPGYKFELQRGIDSINAGARGNGTLNSGATLKALMGFGQGLASTKYNEAFNRNQGQNQSIYNMLAGISGTGQNTANGMANAGNALASNLGSMGMNAMGQVGTMGANAMGQIGSAGQNMANNIGNNMMGAGNAQAAGQIGQANAWSNAIGQGFNAYNQNQQFNRLFGSNVQQAPVAASSGGGWGTGNAYGNQDYGDYL